MIRALLKHFIYLSHLRGTASHLQQVFLQSHNESTVKWLCGSMKQPSTPQRELFSFVYWKGSLQFLIVLFSILLLS